jgi:glycosyltransferase involved in cell wall biosynthesis
VPFKKIAVVPNGYDPTEISGLQVHERNPRCIVVASRLVKTKRIDTLLWALRKIRDEDSELFSTLSCRIIGTGPDELRLKKLCHQLGIAEKVSFMGYIPDRKQFLTAVAQGGLLVHPSAVEGFGIILVEAAALGLPAIVSDIPPFKEVVDQLGGGRLFQLGNAEDLAEAIIRHYKHEPVLTGDPHPFRWDQIAEKLEQQYRALQNLGETA